MAHCHDASLSASFCACQRKAFLSNCVVKRKCRESLTKKSGIFFFVGTLNYVMSCGDQCMFCVTQIVSQADSRMHVTSTTANTSRRSFCMSVRAHERSIGMVPTKLLSSNCIHKFVYFKEQPWPNMVTRSTDQAHEHRLFDVRMDLCLAQRCWLQLQLSLDTHTLLVSVRAT